MKMVKVQKPLPKSLSKNKSNEGVVKEKLKPTKIKKTQNTEVSNLVAELPAKTDMGTSKPKGKAIKKEIKPDNKSNEIPKQKASKKPMILAPPLSPALPNSKTAMKNSTVQTRAKKSATVLAKAKKVDAVPTKGNNEITLPAKGGKKVLLPKKEPLQKKITALTKKQGKNIVSVQAESVPKKKTKAKESQGNKQKTSGTNDFLEKGVTAKPTKLERNTILDRKNAVGAKKVTKTINSNIYSKGKVSTGNQNVSKTKNRNSVKLDYELKSFDEEKFNEIMSEVNVRKICEALKNQVSEEVKKLKTASIFSDYRYVLQVCSYKIPSCPKRIAKLALKHSLVAPDDDVALIVTDLQRGARFDYEPTIQHYEDFLREAGVEQRLTVVPFNRLRNEVGTFEAKRKFLNSYDYLLCDGRISGQATAFLGQFTQKPKNVLHAVRLSKQDELSKEISRALNRTAYRQLRKGDLTAIPVGNHDHSGQQLSENIQYVVHQLQKQFPGGLANIRSMYVKIDIVGTSALPLYISMCSPPADTPYVVGPREKRMLKLKKQANEALSRFALTKDAEFIKLTREQVNRKAELREKRIALKNVDSLDDIVDAEKPIPAKKPRASAKKA
ncbi:ribosomal L1 domain-containing protein CG13096 [Drosophila busckii]|uniref:ribosomal L1 domain-containing protein CG13096 n=1 Tax=Drosophila busckii TaxID=30019 RepID=UPI001432A08D|nr:ribosomal L1 domain-containing protein CG13096 [Drosophila busckii]